MRHKQAIKLLEYIISNQKTVNTEKLQEPVSIVVEQLKSEKKRNKKLQGRVRRQRELLREG